MAVKQTDYIIKGGVSSSGGGAGLGLPFREIPTGIKDGVNCTFRLRFTPAFGYVWVQLNGVVQDPFNSATVGTPEFTLSGNVITFAIAPVATDNLWCWYFRGSGVTLNARRFSGGTDSTDWGTSSALRLVADMSFLAWIKLPSNAQGAIVTSGYAFTSDIAFGLFVTGSAGDWSLTYEHFSTGIGGTLYSHEFATDVLNDQWICVAFVRDSTAKGVTLYRGSGTDMAPVETYSYAFNPGTFGSVTHLQIGNYFNGPGGAAWEKAFIGTMQEYYIWNRILSLPELISAMKGNPSTSGMVLGCASGLSPEVDISGNGGSGTVTGTTLVQGHN